MKIHVLFMIVALSLAPLAALAASAGDTPAGQAYRQANDKMMEGMEKEPSGDADRDFVMMMIPHHQGAIDMAKVELKYGKDPELRKMAEGIVKAQEREIAQMKDWQLRYNAPAMAQTK